MAEQAVAGSEATGNRPGAGGATTGRAADGHAADGDGVRSRRPGRTGVVVLESFGPPRERSNPYRMQLVEAMPSSVRLLYFSWRTALTGAYDVFHVQWPEVVLQGRTRLRTAVRCGLFLLALVRIRLRRRAIVRTLHDFTPYDPLPAPQRLTIRLLDRWTTLWITLADVTPPPRPGPRAVAPIGHYRDWFAGLPRADAEPGRLVHFGLLRRYKGVESLVAAFAGTADEGLSLRIVGYPQDAETAAAVERACRADGRVSAVTEYVPDDDLVREVTASELVVLPFDRVTNSSSLVLALSLDRPVLVPSTPITEAVAAEVGPGWVLTYDGDLGPGDIARALDAVRRSTGRPPPDLSARDWDAVCSEHAAAFARAVTLARSRARSPRREGRDAGDGTG